jgi:hypothetical protein
VVLERSFGFSPRISLVLSAADSMQWMFWAAMAYFVIERVGRYKLMLFGATGCSICFAVAAIGLGVGGNVANGVAVGFIFLYYFFYVSASFDQSRLSPLTSNHRASLSSPYRSCTLRRSTPTDPGIEELPLQWSRTGFVCTSLCPSHQSVGLIISPGRSTTADSPVKASIRSVGASTSSSPC